MGILPLFYLFLLYFPDPCIQYQKWIHQTAQQSEQVVNILTSFREYYFRRFRFFRHPIHPK